MDISNISVPFPNKAVDIQHKHHLLPGIALDIYQTTKIPPQRGGKVGGDKPLGKGHKPARVCACLYASVDGALTFVMEKQFTACTILGFSNTWKSDKHQNHSTQTTLTNCNTLNKSYSINVSLHNKMSCVSSQTFCTKTLNAEIATETWITKLGFFSFSLCNVDRIWYYDELRFSSDSWIQMNKTTKGAQSIIFTLFG